MKPTLDQVKQLNKHIRKFHSKFHGLFESRTAFYKALTKEINDYCQSNMMEMNGFKSIMSDGYMMYVEDNGGTKYYSLHDVNSAEEWMFKIYKIMKMTFGVFVEKTPSLQDTFFKELDLIESDGKIETEIIKVLFESGKYKIKKGENYDNVIYLTNK